MESVLVQWDIRTWLEYLGPVLVYFDVPAVLKCPTLCPRCPSHVPMSHHTNTGYANACKSVRNVNSPLTRTQYENWFIVAPFGVCIDFLIRDHQLETDIEVN